jgi:iron(III) transport system permease protein
MAGGLLVALYTLHDFGAVSLMRFPTFTQAIFLQYRAAFDRTPAAILSLLAAAVAVAVVAVEQAARGRARYHRSGSGVPAALRPVALGRWRWPALGLSAAVIAVGLVLPAGVLIHLLVRGLQEGIPLNLTIGAAGGSIVASVGGAAATLVAAVPIAALVVRYPSGGSRAAERVAYSGYALPGLVVALALVFVSSNYLPAIYQSLPLVIGAYAIMFLPQATEPLKSGLLQSNASVEEVARTLGSSPAAVVRRVIAPILVRPAAVAAALVFLTAMKELPATLLLRPTGFETLATRVWTSASAGLYSRAAVPALLIVVLAAIPLAVLARRARASEPGGR